MNARHFLLAIAVASIAIAACNGGLPTPVGSQAAVPVNSDPGIGLFLGVAPSAPLSNYVVTGAAIPNSVGGHHRVMLLAFTTAASAADSDGDDQTTDPLDLSRDPMSGMPTTPTDDNGAQDVFLSALVSNAEDMSGAFNLRIFDVTQNARCIKCHGQNYPGPCLPGNSHPTHAGGSQCDTNSCTECHMEILP